MQLFGGNGDQLAFGVAVTVNVFSKWILKTTILCSENFGNLRMTVYKSCEDFTAIYEYTLLNFGVAQADKYTEHLESTFQLLLSSPLMRI